MQSEFGIRHSKKQNRPGCGQPLHNDWINNTLLRNYPELVHQLHQDSRKSAGADRHRWGRVASSCQEDDWPWRQSGQRRRWQSSQGSPGCRWPNLSTPFGSIGNCRINRWRCEAPNWPSQAPEPIGHPATPLAAEKIK